MAGAGSPAHSGEAPRFPDCLPHAPQATCGVVPAVVLPAAGALATGATGAAGPAAGGEAGVAGGEAVVVATVPFTCCFCFEPIVWRAARVARPCSAAAALVAEDFSVTFGG